MSRKTVLWRRLGKQAGEERLHTLLPTSKQGKGVWLENGTSGKVCCKPMTPRKQSLFEKATKEGAAPTVRRR